MSAITNHPDEAGLLGSIELAPSWILDGHDAIVAVDIGGTNIRVGVIELKMKKGDVTRAGSERPRCGATSTTSRRGTMRSLGSRR